VSLTIISGLPGSGPEEAARQRLLSAARIGRSALLVVPSSRYASRLLPWVSERCPVGLRIAGINPLVTSEWALKGDGRRIVNEVRREDLLAAALVSGGVAERPGRGAIALLGTLATRVSAQGDLGPGRSNGLSDRIVQALRIYLASLEESGLVEMAAATRLLSSCAPPAAAVGIEGLVALTPDRGELLRGWSEAGCEVVMSLPWQRGCAATLPLDALVARLEAAGARVEPCGPVADERPDELVRVTTGLFSVRSPTAGEGRVVLGVARGEEAEARLIADRVTELLGAGTPGERIAIAFADPGRHAGWLRRSFDDAGIDAAWDIRIPVPETPMGRSMLRLWSFCTRGMQREDITAFVRSPFSGVAADRADRADVLWRRHRLQGRDLLRGADRARPVVAACERIARKAIERTTAAEWKELADRLLANAYGHDAPVPGMDGALDAAVHRAFCQSLESAADGPGRMMAAEELWANFAAASVSPAAQEAPGRVVVTSLEGMRGRVADDVIIGGLTASETPRQGSDDRLEGDAVRGALEALGLVVDPEEQARAERLSFYLAVASATASLTLVRRDTDDDGRPLRGSVFWEEFLDLYREVGAPSERSEGLPPERRREPVGERPGGRACLARGALTDPAALASLAAIESVSPGDIERYAACPYRWFVERRLRPRTPDVEVDVMVAGSVAHSALAAFYRTWKADGAKERVTPELMSEALSLARTQVAAAIADAPEPSTLDEEWLLASVEPAVLALVERDARFLPEYVPTQFEWSFGLGEDEPVDLGGVRIKGRADRIDVGPEGLVVIDYKRSKAKSQVEIEREGLVQLQLYGLAASLRLGLPVAGGLYRSLSTGADRGFISSAVVGSFYANDVVEPSAIEGLLEDAAETARASLEGMRAGRIGPVPDVKHCPFCSALQFCPEGLRS
jgi:RecB family exonuclease